MAEAIAVIGVTASVVQLVEISTKLIIRINEFSSSMDKCPRLFHDLKVRLPILSQTLNQIAASNQGDGSDQLLKRVIEECLGAVTLIEKKLDKILPVKGESGIRRKWKARCFGPPRSLPKRPDVSPMHSKWISIAGSGVNPGESARDVHDKNLYNDR
ncbi:hypothetical protein H2202_000784 [Exophiala xenobiotica]|nr:hypothetical protein H2202_000784 [Exophiala xenobiotica]